MASLSYFFLLWGLCSISLALDKRNLYPYGELQRDRRLPVGDDISSSAVHLQTPVTFYAQQHTSIYVNLNGVLSFDRDMPEYRSNVIFPVGRRLIAPFLSDVDIRLSGNVYYRETSDPALLHTATKQIEKGFPHISGFTPRSLFIVTWDSVGFYQNQYARTNTFQVVIASSGQESFVIFLYPKNGIQWVKGQGKDARYSDDVPAQIGFDAGDYRLFYAIPLSGKPEVDQVTRSSNVGKNGVWIFRVGNLGDSNIDVPYISGGEHRDAPYRSCREGGQSTCSADAQCIDYPDGFCCECRPPYFGNGVTCVDGEAQRISGRVTGIVNDVNLSNADLHTYVVIPDGRTYVAVSRVPDTIGYSLQSAYALGGIFGFMFARTERQPAKRGLDIVGGKLSRTATLTFDATGDVLTIEQTFNGRESHDYMSVETSLNGRVPSSPRPAEFELDDFVEEYRRVQPGVIKSYGSQTYRVNGQSQRVTVDQTINYDECRSRLLNDVTSLTLSVTRNYMVYENNEKTLRFIHTNEISAAGGGPREDECVRANLICDVNADCVMVRNQYQCRCKEGYEGNGQQCRDVDECSIPNMNNCDRNAYCYNKEGGFDCQCAPGYDGDGRTCRMSGGDQTCDVLRNCDRDAQCLYEPSEQRYVCRCNPGFRGDGYRCARQEDCSVRNYCDANAQCVFTGQSYECRCNPGYEGDGTTCRPQVVPCNEVNNCNVNADCLYHPSSGSYQCQCRQGYTGDGYTCSMDGDCRRDPSLCHRDARCEPRGREYMCVCNPGYQGDGYRYCQVSSSGRTDLMYARGMYLMDAPFQSTESNTGKQTLYIPGQTAIGIDIDCYTNYFYWTDVSGGAISRAKLDATDSQVLVQHLGSPEGVAVDWLGKNFYWTDSALDRIEVAKQDGSMRKTLFSTGLVNPRAIAVDPNQGLMFWTDWNRRAPKIEKAHMDGTSRKVLVSDQLGLPNGLALDYESYAVCWADAGTQKIECANYEGQARRSVYERAGYPFGLTYANNILYWTDWQRTSIPNINKYGGEPNQDLTLHKAGNGKLYGLAAMKTPCPSGTSPCVFNNGGCRFFCLPTPQGGRTCTCPDNIAPDECNRISRL